MTSRLVDVGGYFLVDAFGNYLVWELETATGRMSLAFSSPSLTLALSAPSLTLAVAGPSITLTTSED